MVHPIVWAGSHFEANSYLILFKNCTCDSHKWVFWWNMHVTEMKSSSKEFLNTCKLPYHPCLCVLFIMEMMCKWISAKQRQAIGFQTITLSLPIFFFLFIFCFFYRFYFLDCSFLRMSGVSSMLTMSTDTLGWENWTTKEVESWFFLATLDAEEIENWNPKERLQG